MLSHSVSKLAPAARASGAASGHVGIARGARVGAARAMCDEVGAAARGDYFLYAPATSRTPSTSSKYATFCSTFFVAGLWNLYSCQPFP